MALNAAIVFEVRTTGSDTNGGGFKTGASGTDWSQQTSAQYSVTDGVTAGTTTITSATASFGTDVVGNLIYVQGGTGSVAADWYEITARTNATTITVDRSTGLTAGTGVTLKIGGALLTIQKALDLMTVAGHTAYVKSGTYSISAALTTTNFPASNYTTLNRVIGYNSTRTDLGSGGRPVIQTTAAVNGITSTKDGLSLENLDFDGNSTGTIGISFKPTYNGLIVNCISRRWTSHGVDATSPSQIANEYYSNGGAGAVFAATSGGDSRAIGCYSHDNTSHGFSVTGLAGHSFTACIADTNGGDGWNAVYGANLSNCVSYGNTSDGLEVGTYAMHRAIIGCIFASNGAYGIKMTGATPVRDDGRYRVNAFWKNTSGLRSNANAGAGDIDLGSGSAVTDLFVDAANGNFALNASGTLGAQLKAVGYPGVIGGSAATGYLDIGAAQHQDAGSGGGAATLINGGLVG